MPFCNGVGAWITDNLKSQGTRRYLLGATCLASQIRNHIFLFSGDDQFNPQFAAVGANFLVRRSVGGYTLWMHDCSAVYHNLAGIWCATLNRAKPREIWQNTKIQPTGGKFRPPQKVSSWVTDIFLEDIVEFSNRASV